MSQVVLSIDAQPRADVGKGASRRLRRSQNLVPSVLYGANKPVANLTVKHNEIYKAIQNEAFFSSILTLKIDGKAEKVVLKDLQRHPVKDVIMHLDFMRIDESSEIIMHVPLHFIGEETAPGVKNGGVANHAMAELEIKCLPANLPESIDVDVSTLEIGSTLHLSDLTLPKGVKLAHAADEDHDNLVYSITGPREEEVISNEAPVARETEVLADKAKDTDEAK